ncbi:hypothetical protein THAOC_33669 [Thalassiosira oceanica]|uniref:Uncharacterized protein n=1 Tax=Thalassiosira oceanica TaxID=159749 RepID=K0R4P9_THAOC|nr:hypothetical protein THAOC_33669 [Thalassiosira oceanica]|eukprot:EJK47600.1 hypothetical protein THAOC_33669 [Thalassiosira oceanica]
MEVVEGCIPEQNRPQIPILASAKAVDPAITDNFGLEVEHRSTPRKYAANGTPPFERSKAYGTKIALALASSSRRTGPHGIQPPSLWTPWGKAAATATGGTAGALAAPLSLDDEHETTPHNATAADKRTTRRELLLASPKERPFVQIEQETDWSVALEAINNPNVYVCPVIPKGIATTSSNRTAVNIRISPPGSPLT